MKKTRQLTAVTAVLVTALATSAFAETRHRNETNDGWRGDNRRGESQRSFTMEGRVRSFDRDRDGYRVQLDRGDAWYYVPQSALRNRGLKVGVSLRFTGYYDSRGYGQVSSCDWIDDGGYYDRNNRRGGGYGNYDRDFVRGVVERVDYRRGTLLLRDERSNRRVTVVMAGGSRNRRGVDLDDLRRGDFVTFAGDWDRRGVFEAYRIENVRNGRW